MAKCGICGADTFWSGAKLWKAKSWLCSSCIAKAGGFANAPLNGTLDDIQKAIDKNKALAAALMSTAVPFTVTQKVDGFLQLDDNRKLWLVPAVNGSRMNSKIHAYCDILEVELIEDGHSIVKGGVGSAIAGGIILGATGAILGGITASRTSKTVCTDMHIIVTVNSLDSPTEVIRLISTATSKTSTAYKRAADAAQQCLSLFQVIMNNCAPVSSNTYSNADEILRFKNLMDIGVISEEEFEAKKKQLLNL